MGQLRKLGAMKWPLAILTSLSQVLCAVGFAQDTSEQGPALFVHNAMWTEFRFQIYPRSSDFGTDELGRIAEEAFEEIGAIERTVNTWVRTSEASLMNESAATAPFKSGPVLFDLLEISVAAYGDTDGAFDVTVAPLLELYGFYNNEFRQPDSIAVTAALNRVGCDKLLLDASTRTVTYTNPGVRVDFGGIAKGYALDRAADVLKRYGVKSALLSGGYSSILAIGVPPDRDAWVVSIPDATNPDRVIDTVELRNEALSTSGCFRNKAGRSPDAPCDIFDPRTGLPVNGVAHATVIGGAASQMETLSKAFLILDRAWVETYVREHPEIRVVLLDTRSEGVSRAERIGFPEKRNER